MILFKRISYKNFLSTGNQPIEIDLSISQTTLIVGTNGTGKSTLLDALCFVLFNRPFRIIKKEQIMITVAIHPTISSVSKVIVIEFNFKYKEISFSQVNL